MAGHFLMHQGKLQRTKADTVMLLQADETS